LLHPIHRPLDIGAMLPTGQPVELIKRGSEFAGSRFCWGR
jgi:hypothetical protein